MIFDDLSYKFILNKLFPETKIQNPKSNFKGNLKTIKVEATKSVSTARQIP
jgi:hypothetical protein